MEFDLRKLGVAHTQHDCIAHAKVLSLHIHRLLSIYPARESIVPITLSAIGSVRRSTDPGKCATADPLSRFLGFTFCRGKIRDDETCFVLFRLHGNG
jgi:hypothetical protein